MDASEWIALAAVLSTWIATASAVYAKLCVVTSRVDGLLKKIEEMSNSIRRLFEHWDTRPCERNTAALQQLMDRVEALEKSQHP